MARDTETAKQEGSAQVHGGRRTGVALASTALVLALGAGMAAAAAGQLDTSFSQDGKRLQSFNNADTYDTANAVAIDSQGRIVVVGESFQTGGTDADFAIARFLSSGQLDSSFSSDGKLTLNFVGGGADEEANGVAIDSQGRIVVVGYSSLDGATGRDFAIARVLSDGELDSSFSSDGKRVQNFSAGTTEDEANSVAIDSQGRVVVVGESVQTGGTGEDFAIARFLSSGSLDTSFSQDGKRVQNFFDNGGGTDEANGVAIDSEGRIVVAGSSDQTGATGEDFAIARFLAGGSLDSSFSGDGKRVQNFLDNGSGIDEANGLAIDSQDRIVVVGDTAQAATGDDFGIARFLSDGSLDDSFSSDGKRVQNFSAGVNGDEANGVAIDSQGRIVVAGYSAQTGGSGEDFAIARFLSSGSLDSSFSQDGKRVQSFDNGANDDEANAVAIDSQDRIVAVGESDQTASGLDFGIARFLGA